MRTLLISAAVAAATFAALPAAAQDYGRQDRYGYGYSQQGRHILDELRQIDRRIDRAAARGVISRGEARRLHLNGNRIERLYHRYRRNGLSRGEMQDLRNRVHGLRQQLRWERRDDRWDDRRYRRD